MAAEEWVLWGFNVEYAAAPIRLTSGTLARCRRERGYRIGDGWDAQNLGYAKAGEPRPWLKYDLIASAS